MKKFICREDLGEASVPMLRHIITHGNTSTYHWKYGKKPDRVEESTIFIDTADEQDVVENPETVSIVNLHIHTHRQTDPETVSIVDSIYRYR